MSDKMGNRLSHSSIDKYLECSLCWKLHYKEGVRPVRQKSALLFGAALDSGLNDLLLNHNLSKAVDVFRDFWRKIDTDNVDFSKSDLDEELNEYFWIENDQNQHPSWLSLYHKGILFLNQYNKDIIPKIKKIVSVQEVLSLKNSDGDEIYGPLDLIAEWEDGKTYLLDNKSSSVKYKPDSAKTGQQLPLYYYIAKEKYKLDGVGYIVMDKKINKNRVKKCKSCGIINESSHKTCCNMLKNLGFKGNESRCNGEFDVTINPSVDISIILNTVDESDEQRVISTFDDVNNKITNGVFSETHSEKRNKYYQWCPYKEYYVGNPDFYILERKKHEKVV